jgi:hypothetical protein
MLGPVGGKEDNKVAIKEKYALTVGNIWLQRFDHLILGFTLVCFRHFFGEIRLLKGLS